MHDASELVELAHAHNLLAIDDIGSGAILDVQQWGLPEEPTFPASIRAAVAAMQPGQVAEPVMLESGFAILRLERIIFQPLLR